MLMQAETPRRFALSVTPTQQAADWNELRDGYLRRIHEASVKGTQGWNSAWRFLVAHRCYQRELDRRARRVLRATRCGSDWLDDVKQEAVLALSRDIRRETERGTPLDESRFVGWLCCVTSRNCQKAVWNIQRNRAASLVERDVEDHSGRWPAIEGRLDVAILVHELSEIERSAISLWLEGQTPTDMAFLFGKSPQTVRRVLRTAVNRLRQLVSREAVRVSAAANQESAKNS